MRQTLADAIEATRPALAAVADHAARLDRARRALAEAEDRQRAAERQATEARELVMTDAEADRAEVHRSRQAAVEADEECGLLRAARDRAESALREAERSAGYARDSIARAVDKVLVAEADRAFAEAEAAARHAAELIFVARRLAEAGDAFNGERTRLTSRVDAFNVGFLFGRDMSASAIVQAQAVAPWNAFATALAADASAPLPKAEGAKE